MKKPNLLFFLLFAFLIVGCSTEQKIKDNPEQIVKTYFEAWNNQDYTTMYSTMSDGFKKIDPIAKSTDSFVSYASSQGITKIKINSIKKTSQSGNRATVSYEVIFYVDTNTFPFEDTFSLKYKPEDSLPGWKLIHPYGDNIDTT